MTGATPRLEILAARTAAAAENMALDFLLLQRFGADGVARFRHYGWRTQAFTFGYSQRIADVRAKLPAGGVFDLCRRPTGGGLVDHRDDWTFALIVPRGHPLEAGLASESYRAVHACLAEALRAQGVAAVLKPRELQADAPGAEGAGRGIAGACFERAETHDVVGERTGEKIAGAAQKRNKRGLLLQGSIARAAADRAMGGATAAGGDAGAGGGLAGVGAAGGGGAGVDWDRFGEDFTARLGALLGLEAGAAPWPEFAEDEVEGLCERYLSREWMEHR